jgi:hypothetical protein
LHFKLFFRGIEAAKPCPATLASAVAAKQSVNLGSSILGYRQPTGQIGLLAKRMISG